jgi:tetratricopeptide (TPR) repeat protein
MVHCSGTLLLGAKPDFVKALKCYQRAHALAESIGYPTIVGRLALAGICNILIATGKPLSALTHSKEAHRYAEHMGDIYGQAWSLYHQGRCHEILANYQHGQLLLQKSRDMLTACGQQESQLGHNILNLQAEIYLLKSEYLESRKFQVAIASSCQPTSYNAILANLNIAFIDIRTGVDSKIIHQNLQMVQSHLTALSGYSGRQTSNFSNSAAAELCVRDGTPGTANAMFAKCFALSRDISTEQQLLYLERLGDLSTGMNDIPTTLRWSVIFLGQAVKCKEKRQTMQARRCIGQLFAAEGDNETALSLFNVALHGFTLMDVHHWRADCMVRIANILKSRGEVMKAVELWKAARPLFKRSSQMKDIIKIDAKLAEVDSSFLEEYEQQLQ